MNNFTWAAEMAGRHSLVALIRRDERGEAAVGFGLMLPVLVALTFGVLEFSLVTFDFHRATEAARRAARSAAIGDALTDVSGMTAGGSVTCTASGGALSCGGGSADQTRFDAIVAEMQEILHVIGPDNLRITYQHSGIGDPATPGGILPMVTIELIGVTHDYLVLQVIPGISSGFTFPPFSSNYLAGGQGPAP